MLSRRLVVLLDDDRYGLLEREAARRKVSVATVVREAIDARYACGRLSREAGLERVLGAAAMDVPAVEDLRAELAEVRGARR